MMENASHPIRDELASVVIFVASIWLVFLVTIIFPWLDTWGIVPRSLFGLIGIATAPFLHADFQHLLSNTFPLLILLSLLAGSKAQSWQIVVAVVVLGGLLLWLFGRSAIHIGASGLVFGLIVFLIVSGILERRIVPLIVTFVVAFLYGGTLIAGVLPWAGPHMSWDGHLCGAAGGALVAYGLVRAATVPSKPLIPGVGESEQNDATHTQNAH